MAARTLAQWLDWIEQQHYQEIDLGLARTLQVAQNMGLCAPGFPIVSVAGTNGKGSVCTLLASVLQAGGYRVGLYSSPHLLHYNERVRIDGVAAQDAILCESFARIAQHQGTTTLTYFEFGTLAAMDIFSRAPVDVAIMEVGLGGRLDAVNIWSPAVAIITSIGLDHIAELGATRPLIAREKLGIARSGAPLVIGERSPPDNLLPEAAALGAPTYLAGRDYDWQGQDAGLWTFHSQHHTLADLPPIEIGGSVGRHNAATALQALALMPAGIGCTPAQVRTGLQGASLTGRAHARCVRGVPCLFDVAHNGQAICALRETLLARPVQGKTHAVIGCMADKPIADMLQPLATQITHWYTGELPGTRALAPEHLAEQIRSTIGGTVSVAPSIGQAFEQALDQAGDADQIVVFGSFVTLTEILSNCASVATMQP